MSPLNPDFTTCESNRKKLPMCSKAIKADAFVLACLMADPADDHIGATGGVYSSVIFV